MQTRSEAARFNDPEFIRGIEAPFWSQHVARAPHGAEVLEALRNHPVGGRAGWRLAVQLIRTCGVLSKNGGSILEFAKRNDLLEVLQHGPDNYNDSNSLLKWRVSWSQSKATPWDPPPKYEKLPGIGPNTFEYIFRDLSLPGSPCLFKVDSTNWDFVRGTPLAKHAHSIPNSEYNRRKKYWTAMYESGVLDHYPLSVINLAIYAAGSADYMGIYWDAAGDLRAYEHIPSALTW